MKKLCNKKIKKFQQGGINIDLNPMSKIMWGSNSPLDVFQQEAENIANEQNPYLEITNERDIVSPDSPYTVNQKPLNNYKKKNTFEFNPKNYAILTSLNQGIDAISTAYANTQKGINMINKNPLSQMQFSNGRSNQSKYGYSFQKGGKKETPLQKSNREYAKIAQQRISPISGLTLDYYQSPIESTSSIRIPLSRNKSFIDKEIKILKEEGKIKKEQERKRIEERNEAVSSIDSGFLFTTPSGKIKNPEELTWREKLYRAGKALESRGRFYPYEEHPIDEINPLNIVGSLASNIGQAPIIAKQTNSLKPYTNSIAQGLAEGLLGFSPLHAMEKTASKYFLRKAYTPDLKNVGENLLGKSASPEEFIDTKPKVFNSQFYIPKSKDQSKYLNFSLKVPKELPKNDQIINSALGQFYKNNQFIELKGEELKYFLSLTKEGQEQFIKNYPNSNNKFQLGGYNWDEEDEDFLFGEEADYNLVDSSKNEDRVTEETIEQEQINENDEESLAFLESLFENPVRKKYQPINFTYATPSSNLSLGNQQNQVYQYLQSKDLTREAIAGIMGNIQHESNFNPGIAGDNGTSFGLFQHHADRKNKLLNYLKKRGLPANSVQGQIDFALQENSSIIKQVNQARTPQQAADIWVRKFEKPANVDKQSQLRQKASLNYYKQGGKVHDDNGYLINNLHNFTPKKVINSNHITTDQMAFPIIANGVPLYPNTGDYIFPINKVVERPMYQKGGTYYVSNADIANLKQKGIKFKYV